MDVRGVFVGLFLGGASLLQMPIASAEPAEAGGAVFIEQIDQSNSFAMVDQIGKSWTSVRQTGDRNNSATVAIRGDGVNVSVEQHGNDNHFDGRIQGDASDVLARQDGVGHSLAVQITGGDMVVDVAQYGAGAEAEVRQDGFGHRLSLQQNGPARSLIDQSGAPQTLDLSQSAADVATINQSEESSALTVRQTGGANNLSLDTSGGGAHSIQQTGGQSLSLTTNSPLPITVTQY